MYNPTADTSRSLDLSSTPTANAGRYDDPNATVRMAGATGCPIAFCEVPAAGQPGSFATSAVQAVTAKGCTALSASKADELVEEATYPLN